MEREKCKEGAEVCVDQIFFKNLAVDTTKCINIYKLFAAAIAPASIFIHYMKVCVCVNIRVYSYMF